MKAREKKSRKRHHLNLLKVTRKSLGYVQRAVPFLNEYLSTDSAQMVLVQKMAEELETYTELTDRSIDQSKRRVIHGESVPTSQKIVFLFELHTGIIVKDHRDTFYGHKLCVAGGSSNLITDCVILDGNPSDSTLTDQMLDRQR